MSASIILGIDPGLKGALAFWEPDAELLEVLPMPVYTVVRNRKQRCEIDHYKLANILDARASGVRLALVENVGSMPNQGVASAFTFGKVTGIVIGAIAAHLIPLSFPAPGVWKRSMGCTADKDSSRRKASALLPRYAHLWDASTKDGMAEASLLAVYGARHGN